MRHIVNALFVRDGKVLLSRRSPHRAAYAGLWSFPGGHVEQGEALIEALIREIREEVGVTPTTFGLIGTIADPNTMTTDPATYHMYAVTAWDGGEPSLVGDEHTELRWLTPAGASDLPSLALTEYRPLFQRAVGIRHERRSYEEALAESGVMEELARFDPRVAGTPPPGLDLPDSDIDVVCYAPDAHAFTEAVWRAFSSASGFTVKQLLRLPRPVVGSFEVAGWRIELYGEAIPVEQQRGWRHFTVERRLLSLGGEALMGAILALRQQGMKTEPAFAVALKLRGDPYLALLDLNEQDDATLVAVLQARGFR
jgi:mutator protein MutT